MREFIDKITDYKGYHDDRSEAGYLVVTTKQVITLAIVDEQYCCESWGFFMSEDDFDKFEDAELREVAITDENLSSQPFVKDGYDEEGENEVEIPEGARKLYEGGVMFVNLVTDRGTLQFVAYNSQNGYYGHRARVESKQLEFEKAL